ncbi:MAG TPA: CBS domain-containing protein [Casimicrobiaceae bacterium]|nr:CBS domain-containing protein [Casimicrobiaceae bacterium]
MRIRPIRSMIEGQVPQTAAGTAAVSEVARTMRDRNIGALMIVDGSRLTGVFTERDALFRVLAPGRDPATTPVGAVMTPSPQTIHPDKPFVEAVRMMIEGGYRHVPVVENGRVLGMVSVRDALDPEVDEAKKDLATREFDR